MRGTLVLVVGPSGAGKDSIITGAAERFDGDPRLAFARRLITRPAAGGTEKHTEISAAGFADLVRQGSVMLSWEAHGSRYGLPASLAGALEGGRCVVANVSRTVVSEARCRFAPVTVVEVSASPDTLAARLAARGRESLSEIESRLRRAGALSSYDADFIVDNNGALATAVERFTAILRQILDQTPPPLTSG